jgi:hypothetical protein
LKGGQTGRKFRPLSKAGRNPPSFFFRSSKGFQLSTKGLALRHLSPSQANKAITVNDALDGLDGALTQQSVIDVSGQRRRRYSFELCPRSAPLFAWTRARKQTRN